MLHNHLTFLTTNSDLPSILMFFTPISLPFEAQGRHKSSLIFCHVACVIESQSKDFFTLGILTKTTPTPASQKSSCIGQCRSTRSIFGQCSYTLLYLAPTFHRYRRLPHIFLVRPPGKASKIYHSCM
jgi:hypothetical protein